MARLILDTNALIQLDRHGTGVWQIAESDDLAIAAITLAELRHGVLASDERRRSARERFVDDVEELEEACRAFGAHLVVQRMGLRGERGVHDPLRLGAAFSDLFA